MIGTCGLDTLPLPARARRQLGNLVLVLAMGADSGQGAASFDRGHLEISYDQDQEPVFDRIREGVAALEADSGVKISARSRSGFSRPGRPWRCTSVSRST